MRSAILALSASLTFDRSPVTPRGWLSKAALQASPTVVKALTSVEPHGSFQDLMVADAGTPHRFWVALPQLGGAFQVGEQKVTVGELGTTAFLQGVGDGVLHRHGSSLLPRPVPGRFVHPGAGGCQVTLVARTVGRQQGGTE